MNEAHIWEINSDGTRPVGIKKLLSNCRKKKGASSIACHRPTAHVAELAACELRLCHSAFEGKSCNPSINAWSAVNDKVRAHVITVRLAFNSFFLKRLKRQPSSWKRQKAKRFLIPMDNGRFVQISSILLEMTREAKS